MPLAALRQRQSGGATEEEVAAVAGAQAGGDGKANGGREMRQGSGHLWGGGMERALHQSGRGRAGRGGVPGAGQ